MTIKKKTPKLLKKNNKKGSSKPPIRSKKVPTDDVILITEDFNAENVDSHGNLHDSKDNIAISEENYILVSEYQCSMSSYQDSEQGNWRYALELFTEDGKLIDIHSQQTYETYQDSIFDCYGIIEYLGFGVIDPNNRAHVVIHYWDDSKKEFREETVYFDGCDFYQSTKEDNNSGN
jgi:hypothetical protein